MPSNLSRSADLMETIGHWADRIAILENAYFTSLREGTITRSAFVETQMQFFFAVQIFFSTDGRFDGSDSGFRGQSRSHPQLRR